MKQYFFDGSKVRTSGFNTSLFSAEAENLKPQKLFLYVNCEQKEKAGVERSEISELLKLTNVNRLKKYLRKYRLSESDEYQMVVTLGMEMDDENEAEQILCGYIRRFGLQTKAKQALSDLGFERALKELQMHKKEQDDLLDLCEENVPLTQKLQDGFNLMKDDDVADRGIFYIFYGEPVQA